jgi:hypothetical protein
VCKISLEELLRQLARERRVDEEQKRRVEELRHPEEEAKRRRSMEAWLTVATIKAVETEGGAK